MSVATAGVHGRDGILFSMHDAGERRYKIERGRVSGRHTLGPGLGGGPLGQIGAEERMLVDSAARVCRWHWRSDVREPRRP